MQRIGRFEVVKELGRGAMGAVHLARDPLIGREVAIKTIALTGLSDTERGAYRQRFFREAQAAGKLAHTGIVTIYDVGEDETSRLPYIVMEFIAGRTLADILEGTAGPLPLAQSLAWIRQVAQALSYAHVRGITHRDVKPANILITPEGDAKLTDFGIARLRNTHLTTAGDLLGTPAYMSPEQVEGKPADGRSDIFSLGILLYWLLTGQKPFDGENPGEVMFKIAYKDPAPVTQLQPQLSAGFDAIMVRALAKDPQQRYAVARELALDLEDIERGQSPAHAMRVADPAPVKIPAVAERTTLVSPGDDASVLRRTESPGRRVTDTHPAWAMAESAARRIAERAAAGTKESVRLVRGLPWRRWAAFAKAGWQKFRGLPGKVQAGTGAAIGVLLLFVLWDPLFVPKATLEVRCTHDLSSGVLTILVDEREVMEAELTGSTQRRLGVFRRTAGIFTGEARVPVGDHTVRVRVRSDDERILASREVQGMFAKGATRALVIVFDSRSASMRIALD